MTSLRKSLLIAIMLQFAVVSPANAEKKKWWRTEYVADYVSIAAAAGLFFGLQDVPSLPASLGPQYDEDNWQTLLEDRYTARLGRSSGPNTVPGYVLSISGAVGMGGLMLAEWTAGLNGLESTDWQLAHDTVIGYTQAMFWTVAITEVLKVGVGRLRPDFQDRLLRYHCGTLRNPSPPCAGFDGVPMTSSDISEGRRSFVSGHASLSFAMATYWSLVVGGRMVWGDRASAETRPWGIVLQTGFLALASWVAATRVQDGRHHVEDVVVGSLLGFVVANAAYWRHFSTTGLPRERIPGAPQIAPSNKGLGLSIGGTF